MDGINASAARQCTGRARISIPGHVDDGLAGRIVAVHPRRAPWCIEMILDRDARTRGPETYWSLPEVRPETEVIV
jgi:hypothetical protein